LVHLEYGLFDDSRTFTLTVVHDYAMELLGRMAGETCYRFMRVSTFGQVPLMGWEW
jgi:hypothetical protein